MFRLCSAVTLLSLYVSSTWVSAQNVLFEERFDGGIPSAWTNIHSGSSSDVWTAGFALVNSTPDINHEWFCDFGGSWRDNNVVSPPINLSGLTRATFYCEQYQIYPGSIAYNAIEVSTDNGVSFSVLQQVTAPPPGFSVIQVNMDAYAGLPSVRIGLHYRGAIANDWSLDNVRITTSNPLYSIQNLVAGSMATLQVRGAGAGHSVHICASLAGAGPSSTPFGVLNLSSPLVRLPVQIADAGGNVSLIARVPPGLVGTTIYSQAIEMLPGGVGNISNALIQVVQ